MNEPIMRLLERLGGTVLILLGLAWLVLGLNSLIGDTFAMRGMLIVLMIASALTFSGTLLAKPKTSTTGRVIAVFVCVLGALRELILMDHSTTTSFSGSDWIGKVLLALYIFILIVVIANYLTNRRTASV